MATLCSQSTFMICANLGGAVGGTFGNWRLNSSKFASDGDSSSWKPVKNVAVVLVITLKCIHTVNHARLSLTHSSLTQPITSRTDPYPFYCTACDVISFNDQEQLGQLTWGGEEIFYEHDSACNEAREKGKI